MVRSYFRRAYSSFTAHVFDIPPRLMAFLFFLLLLTVPAMQLGSYVLRLLIMANIFAIFAVSWDLLVGRTGQISLGHALFFGIGGYTSGLLFQFFALPIWVTIPAAVAIGALAGFLIGFPCLRVKGPYLALITMAFPLILSNLVKWSPLEPIFGGELGFRSLPPFFPFLPFTQAIMAEYYLILLLLFVSSIVIYKIANSKTGIVFVSILDDEVASKACGINVTRYKIFAFTISSFFASLAGCLQAHILKLANPPMFSLDISFLPVILTFLGGIGTIYGPIVGSYIYVILDRYIMSILLPKAFESVGWTLPREFDFAKLLIFTLIVLVLIIKWPRGLARFATDELQNLEEARDLDERGPRIWKRYKKTKH